MCDVYHDRTYVFDLTTEPPRQVATIVMKGGGYWMAFSPDGTPLLHQRAGRQHRGRDRHRHPRDGRADRRGEVPEAGPGGHASGWDRVGREMRRPDETGADFGRVEGPAIGGPSGGGVPRLGVELIAGAHDDTCNRTSSRATGGRASSSPAAARRRTASPATSSGTSPPATCMGGPAPAWRSPPTPRTTPSRAATSTAAAMTASSSTGPEETRSPTRSSRATRPTASRSTARRTTPAKAPT